MLRERCFNAPPVLHSDNGAPMKSQTMRAKLEELGVASSYIPVIFENASQLKKMLKFNFKRSD
jgi:hypothetical protein